MTTFDPEPVLALPRPREFCDQLLTVAGWLIRQGAQDAPVIISPELARALGRLVLERAQAERVRIDEARRRSWRGAA